MSNNAYIFRFLRDLRNNNSKEWMDENRGKYEQAKEYWIAQCQEILNALSDIDSDFGNVTPKKTIGKINNNLLYHPDKPTYKDYFSCEPSKHLDKKASFYIHMGPGQSFIAGGFYRPDKEKLDKIRKAIDSSGSKLERILNSEEFKKFYGTLDRQDDKLKTSPQGYSSDHKYINLLNFKSFTVRHDLTNDQVTGDNYVSIIEEGYKKIQPFLHFLSEAYKA